ncbi:hypothetical protein P9112_013517 [Eukaryota sp. TZLM1-RC]
MQTSILRHKHKYYYRLRQTGKTKEEIESLLAATTTLYVGNLSFYTSEEQIHALFSRAGRIKRIIMGLNKKSLKPCGFCFVEYYTRASTEIAMRYINRTILDEREIRTDFDIGFEPGRQYGRGEGGGQIRDEERRRKRLVDPGRGDL